MSHILSIITTTLILLLTSPPISSTSTTTVVDFLGNPVEPGSSYYLFFSGVGYFFGSLTMVSKPNHSKCPQFVSVSSYPTDFGPGVKFWPRDPTQTTISLSSDLNIAFASSTNCNDKPVWRLTKGKNNGTVEMITDGVIGDPTARNSWFMIEKVDDLSPISLYKVRYCPSKSTSVFEAQNDDVLCGYLGLEHDKLSMNITLSLDAQGEDYEVYFWPASVKPPLPSKGGLIWG